MKHIKTLFAQAATFILLACLPASAQTGKPNILDKLEASGEFAPMFPFQPTHDAPDNITNVKTWKGTRQGEAGAQGFICADGDHFVDGQGNVRRFLGTNICFSGCFPEKKDAERVAQELARYGINLVRLHYVHHKFPKDREYPEKDSFLEPEQLDRFDYLFAQLKKNGIYTYFQLNIARKFGAQNGFENADKLPWYNNGIDNVDERMISLQEKYHKDILTHKNPYTGLEYRNEPAISMLELANENSIVHAWFAPRYNFPHLTEPYASGMKEKWNEWLVDKYKDTKTLKAAWLDGLKGDGTEYMPEGRMTADAADFYKLQLDKLAMASIEIRKAESKDRLKGKYYAHLTVEKTGATKNMPQFFRNGLKVKAMAPYCLKFKMRGDRNASVGVRFSQAHDPWRVSGLSTIVQCGTKWKEYTLNFTANMDDDNVRLVISDFTPGSYDIADVSLVSGVEYKWDGDKTLEEKNFDWPYKADWSALPQRAVDFTEFIASLESAYFDELFSNLKTSVLSRQPVTGTQLHYGLDQAQAGMDYIDYHNYWGHPTFPHKSWDSNDWNLTNNALVNGDGFPCSSLSTMARSRILGKPFTISEYDHPSLNFYSAEGDLLISAIGAFQNWSGIMQFAWTHSTNFFRTVRSNTFDLCSATQKLVHFPACYSMFVRGDVRTGDASTVFTSTADFEKDVRTIAIAQNAGAPASLKDKKLAATALATVAGRQVKEMPEPFSTEGRTVIRGHGDIPETVGRAYDSKELKSSTGELTWNWQKSKAGYFIADSPLTKVFTGFVRGRQFEFDGMTLKPGKTRLDWITFSLTCTNPGAGTGKGRLAPGTYLLAATGLVQNTGQVIVAVGNDRISCARNNGGNQGVAPVLCEGIPATIVLKGLAGKVKCHALDPSGSRTAEVTVKDDGNGGAEVYIGPGFKTVWYELTIE